MRLIEKVWFHKHPAKWLLVPLLLPPTLIFSLLSALRRALFHIGISSSYKMSKPVIIVGNIGVGGNGKTPIVIYLVELCRTLNLTPGVISRGYGGNAPHYPYLLNEESTAEEAGDEPILIKQRCQVPIAVGSDRIASAELLIERGCNIIISDDGLQHYRLNRDLELVIIDGKRLFGNGLLLPAGPLREGQWRLNNSDLVIYNGAKVEKEINNQNSVPKLNMSLIATKVCNLQTGQEVSLNDFTSSSSSVNAIAGIGSPQRFFDTLTALDFTLIKQQSFVDHHSFSLTDFIDFDDNIPLLMTEKDAVKCQSFSKDNWWYLPVNAHFTEQEKEIVRKKITTLIDSNS